MFHQKHRFTPVIISVFMIVIISLAFAGGGIKGKVTESKTGEAFDGATIAIQDPETGVIEFSTLSTDGGQFDLYGIPAGKWKLFVTAIDYDTTFATIEIIDGEDLEVEYSISEYVEHDDTEYKM